MNLSTEQLAELLAGIARAQQAIVDAVESENGGWKNTHMLPKVTSAANMRLATPRLIDVPSRILLRSQSRVPMDVPTIVRMLNEAVGAAAPAAAAPAAPVAAPAAAAPAAPVAAPVAAAAVVGAGVVAATAAESTPTAGNDDLSNFFDT
ncbi:MAG: hypothetical protein JNN20_02070 [Betaproteobacteria bacterium]|nr:hypothetical protein [Betaproteobacteria bacterium]